MDKIIDKKVLSLLRLTFGKDVGELIAKILYDIEFKERYSKAEEYLSNLTKTVEQHTNLVSHLKRLINDKIEGEELITHTWRYIYEKTIHEDKFKIVIWYGGACGKTLLKNKLPNIGRRFINSYQEKMYYPYKNTPWFYGCEEIFKIGNVLLCLMTTLPDDCLYNEAIEFTSDFSSLSFEQQRIKRGEIIDLDHQKFIEYINLF